MRPATPRLPRGGCGEGLSNLPLELDFSLLLLQSRCRRRPIAGASFKACADIATYARCGPKSVDGRSFVVVSHARGAVSGEAEGLA
jgi:hypothetical protein